ncbi:MAG: hydroxyacid dehydrogenase [Candidatus Pacebacteria bacterium CG_4_10_14_3_um_filter_34_15]|nr:D-2-hydroxyacid dehydrogenase [Candidatus Pacearchaeota archaeon]NCQ65886.1 D-2-hydroxyacid dehydrogenase [Candidatus Paceibacterota bacterium]PIQ80623.1 MAG: hydroxyacid dehydrogenase [Candidatus Pacebacteria bacterium CG11_big_fil_rev_8_21_14_0_20_34_55]PIX81623.1 MAG: hydroxyacid dehydrogenase [Candidatus Pacebacteria bacterium CG_4_10_14_3_um_filter_34_15]PJC43610.1 MAG: hydroxyacid dehydrogenase [Candidatus Pacebacteria bacterium CG_4_9_14_0_2_um_filter_34_50]
MKILILKYRSQYIQSIMKYEKHHLDQITSIFPDSQIVVIDSIPEEINKHLPDTDILIMSPLDHIQLVDFSKTKQLKWIHQTAAGTVPLVEKLKGTSIILTNSSGVHPIPIAEQIFTFILMLSRQFHRSYRNQIESKKWIQNDIDGNLLELYQSTIGIVGFGRIGKRVAKIAKAFDMRVLTLSSERSPETDPNVDVYFSRNEVESLLKESDFVVDCLPSTTKTDGYFNQHSFEQMKSSAFFINIGRGSTVIEKDLITALKNKVIAGAGLDVFSKEPLDSESELWNLKNVILTPHYAGWTPRYIDRVINIFCDNLKAYIKQDKMPNFVPVNEE